MQRRNFIRLAGGGMVLAATAGISACSTDMPSEAVAAWSAAGAETTDVRRWILSYAILAPHSHNLQSWIVDLRQPGEITLQCMEGLIEVRTGGSTLSLRPGQLVLLPAKAPHSVRALEDSSALLTMCLRTV